VGCIELFESRIIEASFVFVLRQLFKDLFYHEFLGLLSGKSATVVYIVFDPDLFDNGFEEGILSSQLEKLLPIDFVVGGVEITSYNILILPICIMRHWFLQVRRAIFFLWKFTIKDWLILECCLVNRIREHVVVPLGVKNFLFSFFGIHVFELVSHCHLELFILH